MPLLTTLSRRLAALPIDRAPLRRAALLTVLLAVLLVATRMIAPARPRPAAEASRQSAPAGTESLSARPAPRRSGGWGQAAALLLLVGGGGAAFVLRKRTAPGAERSTTLEVLESHTLAQGQSLRLVACGEEVLLLSVGGDGARLLRHWPRDRFDGERDGDAMWASLASQTVPTDEHAPVDAAGVTPPVATPVPAEVVAVAPTPPLTAPVPPTPRPAVPAVPPQFATPAAPSTPAFADVLRQFGVGHA